MSGELGGSVYPFQPVKNGTKDDRPFMQRFECREVGQLSLLSFRGPISFEEQNSPGSNFWFRPLAVRQRVEGALEKVL